MAQQEAQEAQVISIDGKDYTEDQLTDNQKYFINQINDLQVKTNQAKFQLDQLNAAKDAFTQQLIKSLQPKD
tara:strand:- start:363 stop:578 length:216 start_codon:yes stop_codon:yes gene_type:complete